LLIIFILMAEVASAQSLQIEYSNSIPHNHLISSLFPGTII